MRLLLTILAPSVAFSRLIPRPRYHEPTDRTRKFAADREDLLWLDNLAEVSIHGQPIVLCYYALRVWNRSNRGSWQLYGYSHGRSTRPISVHGTMTKSPTS